jgi:NADPH-dependent 2,4-dienoyl-CoA reductase/sulfur reductase-like enzyme/rhodanese-related sulfurtransferase
MNAQDATDRPLRIVVIGGVAGGASAAARARRTNANAEITVLEKGPYVSFANCGIPYHLGGEIAQRSKLLVTTAELFWNRFRIAVRTGCEATRIDRAARVVAGIDHATGQSFTIPYDRLILSTGSEPISPAFMQPPCDNVRHLWTLPDMDAVLTQIQAAKVGRAVVVGAGFVGLEVVEQLTQIGIQVDLIERLDQALKPLDRHLARIVERELRSRGVTLHLASEITGLRRTDGRATAVELADGTVIPTDLIVVGAGVRPRVAMAVEAGLAIGKTGGLVVDEFMRTADPNIYAVGDMVEYHHGVLDSPMRIPLAGPANRSGRIAGAHAACGNAQPMGPVLGTSIVRVFGLTAACTGMSEAALDGFGIAHRAVIIQAAHHAGYFPGAESMFLKLVYSPGDGRILGAQCVGGQGVDKRMDVIATAMHFGGTVYQLAQLDLAYAPPFGSAKDPVHMAAFAAINDLEGQPSIVPPGMDLAGYQVLDVRSTREREELPLAGAIGIPVDELADRWGELDPTLPTITVCHSGKRAHVAACWLRGKGWQDVRNLTGGMAIRSIEDP